MKQLKYPSKAKHRCPTRLAEAMNIVNLIGFKEVDKFQKLDTWAFEYLESWTDFYDSLPEKVKKFVVIMLNKDDFPQPATDEDYLKLHASFQNLLLFRDLLFFLRKTHAQLPAEPVGENETKLLTKQFQDEIDRLISPIYRAHRESPFYESEEIQEIRKVGFVFTKLSPNFIIDFEIPPLLQILKQVDVLRIRECEFCGNTFWAQRMNAIGCSLGCSNALRQRKFREKKLKN